MLISYGKSNTILFVNSIRGKRQDSRNPEGRTWEGFTEEVIWEPSVEDYVGGGFC